MKNITLEMQKLIEESYKIFTRPLGDALADVCTYCCISRESEILLLKTPVKELTPELIYEYLEALFVDHKTNEICHFLPRILELLVEGKYIRHTTEITLNKCSFDKPFWNSTQLDFMQRFSMEFMKNVFHVENGDRSYYHILNRADSYILMFYLSGLPIDHLLKLWEDVAVESSVALEDFESMLYSAKYTYYKNPFADSSFCDKMNAWMQSSQTAKIFLPLVEKYYFDSEDLDAEMAWRWEYLYGVLETNLKK